MNEATALRELRAWIESARWGLLDALVTIKLSEENREDRAKRKLATELRALDEFRDDTTPEEPGEWPT